MWICLKFVHHVVVYTVLSTTCLWSATEMGFWVRILSPCYSDDDSLLWNTCQLDGTHHMGGIAHIGRIPLKLSHWLRNHLINTGAWSCQSGDLHPLSTHFPLMCAHTHCVISTHTLLHTLSHSQDLTVDLLSLYLNSSPSFYCICITGLELYTVCVVVTNCPNLCNCIHNEVQLD